MHYGHVTLTRALIGQEPGARVWAERGGADPVSDLRQGPVHHTRPQPHAADQGQDQQQQQQQQQQGRCLMSCITL